MKNIFPTSDSFNPILVRELRQMVRNRLVVLFINLYLGVMFVVFGMGMVGYLDSPDTAARPGQEIFYRLLAITTIASLLTVVLYSGWKVAVDRVNEDLLFFTSLTPSQNIRGRIICGFIISLLFFSMSAPFIVTTYFFRGIDVQMYVAYIPSAFLLVQVINLISVAIFSAVRSYFQLIFYALLFLVVAGAVSFFGVSLFAEIEDITRRITTGSHFLRWVILIPTILIGIASLIFVSVTSYLFGRCNLSPYSDNRMCPVRCWLFGAIIGSFFLGFVYVFLVRNLSPLSGRFYYVTSDLPFFWFFATVGILSMMLVMAVCERETWEGRLRRSIPKTKWLRALVFPFYTGSVNGLFWVFLGTFFLAVFLSIFTLMDIFKLNTIFPLNRLFQSLFFLMLIFDYSMTAFFLWKIVLHYWIPREMIWMITVGLLAAVSFGTFFATFLIQGAVNSGFENDILLSPNPFLVFMGDALADCQVYVALIWFILIILCGYPWLRGRFLDFTPDQRV